MSLPSKLLETFREKRWARWLGYAAFSWITFTLALFLTFPSDAVKEKVLEVASRQLGLNLRIESTSLAFPMGLSLHETFLILREPNPEEQKGAIAIHVERLTVRPDFMALVTGKTGLKVDAKLWGGNVSGKLRKGKDGQVVDVTAKGIALGQSVLAPIGLDLDGQIDLIELSVEGSTLTDAKGTLKLEGKDLLLKGGEIAEFSLPKMTLGRLEGLVAIGDGRVEIETFDLDGADIEAKLDGNIRLAQSIAQSTLQTSLSFKPSQAWWDANEMLKAGASMALPAGSDGFHTVHLYGQLGKPRFRTR